MKGSLKKRIANAACAFAVLISSICCCLPLSAAAQEQGVSCEQQSTQLQHQSFELHPNGEGSGQTVKLDGMMPQGAKAEAVDVFFFFKQKTAYEITISKDETEFQPEEDHPIKVEITDPSISGKDSKDIQLWHILDDGSREQVTDITVKNGKISFYATGFSVYEIVTQEDEAPGTLDEISTIADLYTHISKGNGVYIATWSNFHFVKNEEYIVKGSRKGILKDPTSYSDRNALKPEKIVNNSSEYFFEDIFYNETSHTIAAKIWCKNSKGVKQYVKQSSNSLSFETDAANATTFSVETSPAGSGFLIAGSGTAPSRYCWNQQGGNNGNGIAASNNDNDPNARFSIWNYTPPQNDQYNGKSYGIFHYSSGSTSGDALMSGGKNHSLVKLILTAKQNNKILYVDENKEIDKWTFTRESNGSYVISVGKGSSVKYLCVGAGGVSVTANRSSASRFTVTGDSNDRVQLSSGGYYIVHSPSGEDDEPGSFGVTTDKTDPRTWLYLLDQADLTDDDLITFSADRVSISDVKDGEKVIVYIRIWNEDELKYDIYAVNHDGSLFPCYASGGKILWLGEGTSSLEWEFTEYLDEVTKQPNYYYELFNPYSEKYFAPQMNGSQVLSDDKIGINLPGRRNGEFYSEIIAWDNSRYSYIGLRPKSDNSALEPCSESVSFPFYFARLENLNLGDDLHTVPTVDNDVHGIKMKIKDFSGDVNHGETGGTQQTGYLGNNGYVPGSATTGLLSTDLDSNGYPIAAYSNSSLSGLYNGAQEVNHLFIESVYNSSGYFEFDSTQNFATLVPTDDGNFTVYRELGTSYNQPKYTLQHGQFFPYNTITAGVYSKDNPLNLYSSDARPGQANTGLLLDTDPRKYEKLYSAGNKNQLNYYFGLEMEAEFVQTVSGLDAWGHDIIFEFKGDDDFWLYVDGELVIDLGGIHSALEGKVNFRTGKVTVNGKDTTLKEIFRKNLTDRGVANVEEELDKIFEDNGSGQYIFKDYTKHKMRVFYMERGAGASNLYMHFNIASVTPGHVVVSKNVTGTGSDAIDKDFIEYPFQIYYSLNDGPNGEPGEERLLANDDEHIRVTYQNSNQPVTYVKKYRPPGFSDEDAYENIYFINPTKKAEISFPENTINYRIVECAVDSSIYGKVLINGNEVPEERVEIKGDLRSYSSEIGTSENKPNIAFDNVVNDNVIKDLYITKKLLDEDDHEITNDPATFSFRLYLSSIEPKSADNITAANMAKYCVLSPNKKVCRFDHETGKFAETDLTFNHQLLDDLSKGAVSGWNYDDVVFRSSGFGAISGIPSGYTICVPGLPVGSVFKVTEDVKTGYGLMGYERVMGLKINDDNTQEDIPSYHNFNDSPLNVGRVIAEENPQMEVINKKGFGLSVRKVWSDLDITVGHAPVYTAVYVDGELLEGSVKQIQSPSTTAYYFWPSLKPKKNGLERINLNDYVVKEVTISNTSPDVAYDGTVTDYGTVTPVESDSSLRLFATRKSNAIPEGEDAQKEFNYIVSYSVGNNEGSTRTDTITNTRESGIAIRLFKWDSTVPLEGGKFKLVDDTTGKTVGTYTSDSKGIVKMLYDFDMSHTYTLTQTSAPKGYVGLQKDVRFKVNADETVSLFYDDMENWGKKDPADLKWANGKPGSNGITAYVDIYNKQFNFKIMKMDSEDPNILLGSAHFELYKQSNTAISGFVKYPYPMEGFEDLVTVNGVVDVCGGNSSRVINPGEKGSVYFLTEKQAPFNYKRLQHDIMFHISPLGVPSLISDSCEGELIETEDSYIYTLSVTNIKENAALNTLTVEKLVKGSAGNKNRDFGFVISVNGLDSSSEITWAKNGEKQDNLSHNGGEFTLKHAEKAEFVLPAGVTVTVMEEETEYNTTFQLGDEEAENKNIKEFQFTDPTTLVVTNTLNGHIPTGVMTPLKRGAVMIFIAAVPIGLFIYLRRRKEQFS